MPTILRDSGYRFFFYSREGNEPPHIHVGKADAEAKYWLSPVVLADNEGFSSHEIHRITRIVKRHCKTLEMAYNKFHGL